MIPRKVVEEKKQYRAVCHTACFWENTYWDPGDIYEGVIPPGKHFSADGSPPEVDPSIRRAVDDPRSTVEMRTTLERSFGEKMPEDATRKQIYSALRKRELAKTGQGGIKAKS